LTAAPLGLIVPAMARAPSLLLSSLLPLLALVLPACSFFGHPDDDDTIWFDDDDLFLDDDDVAFPDDDDGQVFDYDGISFSVTLTVTPPWEQPVGDDDDSSVADDDDSSLIDDDDSSWADDDDSAWTDDDDSGDDDDSALQDDDDSAAAEPGYTVSADFVFSYWTDLSESDRACDQFIHVEGVADFGAGSVADGSCDDCTGVLRFDPATLVDTSDYLEDPTQCDPPVLIASGRDFGIRMLMPAGQQTSGGIAWGDFLELALMDAVTMEALELTASLSGNNSPSDIAANVGAFGNVFTHVAFVNRIDGSFAAVTNLDSIAATAGPESTWFFYFYLYLDPAENEWTGQDMVGTYRGRGFWVINFG